MGEKVPSCDSLKLIMIQPYKVWSYRFSIPGRGILRVASFELQVRVASCELRVESCEFKLRVASCELTFASCVLKNASSNLRVASFSYLRVENQGVFFKSGFLPLGGTIFLNELIWKLWHWLHEVPWYARLFPYLNTRSQEFKKECDQPESLNSSF